MANVLPREKQVAAIGPLAEGAGVRQVERITGTNRNTIMNLGAIQRSLVMRACCTLGLSRLPF